MCTNDARSASPLRSPQPLPWARTAAQPRAQRPAPCPPPTAPAAAVLSAVLNPPRPRSAPSSASAGNKFRHRRAALGGRASSCRARAPPYGTKQLGARGRQNRDAAAAPPPGAGCALRPRGRSRRGGTGRAVPQLPASTAALLHRGGSGARRRALRSLPQGAAFSPPFVLGAGGRRAGGRGDIPRQPG